MSGALWQSFGRTLKALVCLGSGAIEREFLLKEGRGHLVTTAVMMWKYSHKGCCALLNSLSTLNTSYKSK